MGQIIKESPKINNSFECKFINSLTSREIDQVGKAQIRKFFLYLRIAWSLLNHLLSFKPQICYYSITASGIGFYKDAFLITIIKLFRLPIVFHFHNKGIRNKQDNLVDNFLYKFVLKNSQVILLSENLYSDIEKYVSIKLVHLCPNGIPNNNIPLKLKTGKTEKVTVLFLSNLIKSKGVFILLEACKMLKNRKVDFKCNFIGGFGDITEEQFNKKIDELGILDIATYGGKKYNQEKEEAYTSSDIFAFPTYYHNECFPLVILEAMQHSLPVISTFEGGIPSMVDDGVTGFLTMQQDVNAFADKLEVLINNKKLRDEMGKAARIKFEKNYTIEIFENNLSQILSKILKITSSQK